MLVHYGSKMKKFVPERYGHHTMNGRTFFSDVDVDQLPIFMQDVNHGFKEGEEPCIILNNGRLNLVIRKNETYRNRR